MKKVFCILSVIASVFVAGCITSYHQYMTQDERIEARYKEQVEGQCLKRTFVGVITLGFSEIWYRKATRTYKGVLAKREADAAAERMWQEWRQAQIGKTRADVVSILGRPDYDEPDGSGGRMLTWEDSSLQGSSSSRGYVATPYWGTPYNYAVGGNWSTKSQWKSTITTTRLWVVVNDAGKVVSVGRRTKEAAAVSTGVRGEK